LLLNEAFQQIYVAESTQQFEGLLNDWYYWATHSQLAPIVKVAKTIKRHWDGIVSWKKSQIN
jgi:transposase